MLEELEDQFTKYEVARIIGARALQIAMDAPLLLKIDEKELENINYNPIDIAKRELLAGVLPITVNRPLPKKKEAKIKKLSKEEIEELRKKEEAKEQLQAKPAEEKKEDEKSEKAEESEEEKVVEDAEIMELSNPDDESEEASESTEEEGV